MWRAAAAVAAVDERRVLLRERHQVMHRGQPQAPAVVAALVLRGGAVCARRGGWCARELAGAHCDATRVVVAERQAVDGKQAVVVGRDVPAGPPGPLVQRVALREPYRVPRPPAEKGAVHHEEQAPVFIVACERDQRVAAAGAAEPFVHLLKHAAVLHVVQAHRASHGAVQDGDHARRRPGQWRAGLV